MHTRAEHKFENEDEAIEFSEAAKASRAPNEDKYVSAPIFIDEERTYQGMSWVNKTAKYWLVIIETYE